ncbi:MAG TPA: GspH/FimT family protein [Candidatus Acidoferrales bacterium]|nr:GspH/FimT family protein [Candidatus Acidoferrales bacterium]
MTKERDERPKRKAEIGFTLIEVTVSVVVMMIIAAIAIPSIMQGWNSYRLTSAADSVAGLLERTRFEAIHKNGRLSCVAAQVGGLWVVAIDENGNGQPDPTEPQVDLPGPATFVGAGVAPGPASMGPSYAAAIVPNGSLTFDARGTVFPNPGAPPPYVTYIGIPNQPTYGFRAVTVTAMGQVKVWQAAANGSWVAQ